MTEFHFCIDLSRSRPYLPTASDDLLCAGRTDLSDNQSDFDLADDVLRKYSVSGLNETWNLPSMSIPRYARYIPRSRSHEKGTTKSDKFSDDTTGYCVRERMLWKAAAPPQPECKPPSVQLLDEIGLSGDPMAHFTAAQRVAPPSSATRYFGDYRKFHGLLMQIILDLSRRNRPQ
jgi:hypothetical protein